MQRVAVIGNTAGGKSTLARALASAKRLPYHEIDRLVFERKLDNSIMEWFRREHASIVAGPRWVIDGFGPLETLDPMFERADAIVHIDLPVELHIQWATRRANALNHAQDATPDRVAEMQGRLGRLIAKILAYHRRDRPRVVAALARWEAGRSIFRLRSPAEIDAFRAGHCGGAAPES